MLFSGRRLLKAPLVSTVRNMSSSSSTGKMKLSLCQLSVTDNKAANIQNCVDHISKCGDADVIVSLLQICEVIDF